MSEQIVMQAVLDRVTLAVSLIASERDALAEIAQTIERAHTLGPFIDPTRYRDALDRGDMDRAARLIRRLEPVIELYVDEIAPELERRRQMSGSSSAG